jgi:hypothetical protein
MRRCCWLRLHGRLNPLLELPELEGVLLLKRVLAFARPFPHHFCAWRQAGGEEGVLHDPVQRDSIGFKSQHLVQQRNCSCELLVFDHCTLGSCFMHGSRHARPRGSAPFISFRFLHSMYLLSTGYMDGLPSHKPMEYTHSHIDTNEIQRNNPGMLGKASYRPVAT